MRTQVIRIDSKGTSRVEMTWRLQKGNRGWESVGRPLARPPVDRKWNRSVTDRARSRSSCFIAQESQADQRQIAVRVCPWRRGAWLGTGMDCRW